jgi:hypothetical protein
MLCDRESGIIRREARGARHQPPPSALLGKLIKSRSEVKWTADSRQQTADSRRQTADSRQQTADSRQQKANIPGKKARWTNGEGVLYSMSHASPRMYNTEVLMLAPGK